jgi:hypothetical protein
MHQEEKPAYIIAMSVCAAAEIAGMMATNQSCALSGQHPTYKASDFNAVSERYGIHHNAVIELLRS